MRAVAAVYLLLPQIPMLFMGEEWGAAQPFPFFCDFGPELADAVRKGRREEFARFPEFQDPAMRERIPDPMAEETFASAKLDWEDLDRAPHAGWLDWYRRVLAVRHAEIVPRLAAIRSGGQYEVIGDGAVIVRWQLGEAMCWSWPPISRPDRSTGFPRSGRVLWQEGEVGEDGTFGPWAVRWSIEDGVAAMRPEHERALDEWRNGMGIEPEFRNAEGEIVRDQRRNEAQLLAAMGIEAADELHMRAALDELDRAEWLRPLPVDAGSAGHDARPPRIEADLPAGHPRNHLAFDIGGWRRAKRAHRVQTSSSWSTVAILMENGIGTPPAAARRRTALGLSSLSDRAGRRRHDSGGDARPVLAAVIAGRGPAIVGHCRAALSAALGDRLGHRRLS